MASDIVTSVLMSTVREILKHLAMGNSRDDAQWKENLEKLKGELEEYRKQLNHLCEEDKKKESMIQQLEEKTKSLSMSPSCSDQVSVQPMGKEFSELLTSLQKLSCDKVSTPMPGPSRGNVPWACGGPPPNGPGYFSGFPPFAEHSISPPYQHGNNLLQTHYQPPADRRGFVNTLNFQRPVNPTFQGNANYQRTNVQQNLGGPPITEKVFWSSSNPQRPQTPTAGGNHNRMNNVKKNFDPRRVDENTRSSNPQRPSNLTAGGNHNQVSRTEQNLGQRPGNEYIFNKSLNPQRLHKPTVAENPNEMNNLQQNSGRRPVDGKVFNGPPNPQGSSYPSAGRNSNHVGNSKQNWDHHSNMSEVNRREPPRQNYNTRDKPTHHNFRRDRSKDQFRDKHQRSSSSDCSTRPTKGFQKQNTHQNDPSAENKKDKFNNQPRDQANCDEAQSSTKSENSTNSNRRFQRQNFRQNSAPANNGRGRYNNRPRGSCSRNQNSIVKTVETPTTDELNSMEEVTDPDILTMFMGSDIISRREALCRGINLNQRVSGLRMINDRHSFIPNTLLEIVEYKETNPLAVSYLG